MNIKMFHRKSSTYKPHKISTRTKIRLRYYHMLLKVTNLIDRICKNQNSHHPSTESFPDENEDFINSGSKNSSKTTKHEFFPDKPEKNDSKHSHDDGTTIKEDQNIVKKPSSSSTFVRMDRGESSNCVMDPEKPSQYSLEEVDQTNFIEPTSSKRRIHRHIKRRIRLKDSQESHLSVVDHDDDESNLIKKTLQAETEKMEILHSEKVSSIPSKSSQTEGESTIRDNKKEEAEQQDEEEEKSEQEEDSKQSSGSEEDEKEDVKPAKKKLVHPLRDDKKRAEVAKMWLLKKRKERTQETIAETFSTLKTTLYGLTHRKRNRGVVKPPRNINFGMQIVDPRKTTTSNSNIDNLDQIDENTDNHNKSHDPAAERKLKRDHLLDGETTWWSKLFGAVSTLNFTARSPPSPKPKNTSNDNLPSKQPLNSSSISNAEENTESPPSEVLKEGGHGFLENNYVRPKFTQVNNNLETGYPSYPHIRATYYGENEKPWRNYVSSSRTLHDIGTGYDSSHEEAEFYYKPKSTLTAKYTALLRK